MSGLATRTKALTALALTVAVAIGAWFFMQSITVSGLSRLERIDIVRAYCDSIFKTSVSETDSQRIRAIGLPDTIDPRSKKALSTCGSLEIPQ